MLAAGWLRADAAMVLWTLMAAAERLATRRFRSAVFIRDVETAKDVARNLLQAHPLRAADALQLAAALLWTSRKPMGRVFHTFDVRLADAARKEGFTVPTA